MTTIEQDRAKDANFNALNWLRDQQTIFDRGGASKDRRPEQTGLLIECQQKAIDLLLRAIEPFADEASQWTEDTDPSSCFGFDGAFTDFNMGDLRAARSAKEQAERILKGEES